MNPSQELKMNISQVIQSSIRLAYTAGVVDALEKKVEEQEKTIQFLTSKMEGVSDLLYQFVGGLFCQKTQSSIINMHLNCLYSEEIKQGEREKLKEEDADINSWPTTRQGDSNEKRIEALEAQIKKLTDFGPIDKVFEEEDDFCESDHEDMREDYEAEDEEDSALLSLKHMRSHIISMYMYSDSEDSSSTHSSMPGLIDDDLSSVSSSDIRVRISSELCGNE